MLPSYHYEDNTDGSLLKSVGKPLRDYKIEGNCFQDGVPSPENPIEVQCCGEKTKNLLPFPYTTASVTRNGVTVTVSDDGSICIDGTSTAATSFYLFSDKENLIPGLKIGDTITLSKNPNDESQHEDVYFMCNYYDSSGTMKQGIACTLYQTRSGTISEEWVGVGCYIHVPVGRTLNNLVLKPQIELGDTATEYEPYGYKVPVTVEGKNMFDFDSVTEMRNSSGTVSTLWEKDGEELIVDRSKYGGGIYFPCNVARLKAGTYTLSSSVYMPNKSGAVYMGYQVNTDSLIVVKQISVNEADTWVNIQASFEVAADTDIVGIVLQGGGTENYNDLNVRFKNIQLEKGNSATKYEPYFEPETYNIYLDEPLRKVGDYADYIDFKSGKVLRNIDNIEITGDETWTLYSSQSNHFNLHLSNVYAANPGDFVLCNYYPASHESGGYYSYSSHAVMAADGNRIRFKDESYSTVEEWVDRLKSLEVPMNVSYVLSTPTESDIILPKIFTEKGTNIISVGTTLQPSTVNYQYYKGGK